MSANAKRQAKKPQKPQSRNIQVVPLKKKKKAFSKKDSSITKVLKAQETSLTNEMKIWLVLGVLLLLLLCVLHLCPGLGFGVYSLMHGMFGTLAYVFPILVGGSYLFSVANKGNPQATIKNIAFWCGFVVVSALLQLFSFASDKLESPIVYYQYGQSFLSGGVIGGTICGIFQSLFGFLGTLLVLGVAFIICCIGVTQRSIMKPISTKTKEVYVTTKQEIEKKKVERKKAPVSVKLEAEPEVEPKIEEEKEEPKVEKKPEPEVEPVARNIHRSEEIYAKKETKTLQEMDLLDEATSTPMVEEPAREEVINFIHEPDILEEEVQEPIPVAEERKIEVVPVRTVATPSTPSISATPKSVQEPIKSKPKPKVVSNKPYRFPPIECLKLTKSSERIGDDELNSVADKLQQTLRDFGVGVTVTDISCGPTVTRYELHPDQGVKVSRIRSLTDDIKLSLAAADIRIEAPIPGKSAIGIEVPNSENQIVSFRELVSSPAFKKHPSKLAFAVGKDISGHIIVTDLAKTPHLLIAGATGSGKSVCINTLIMSILYKAKPDEVKFLMIDPKVVELSIYNGIPHLLIPVVTDAKKAANALNWAVVEMDERYKKMSEYGVRDVKGYNKKIEEENKYLPEDEKKEKLSQIVIIVDELADLMMVASSDVETAICRLAQKARAADMHLVLATQRPSVNVITGVIKANIPSRMAFAVSSSVDSRTIIDEGGAEKLLGKGDMLYAPAWLPSPIRVQGAFISDDEVFEVVDFLNNGEDTDNEAQLELEKTVVETTATIQMEAERDDYFEQAARFVIEKDKATIGMMQRAFKIGFNRAARIMDQLFSAEIVGPEEGTKPRKVLMSLQEFEETLK